MNLPHVLLKIGLTASTALCAGSATLCAYAQAPAGAANGATASGAIGAAGRWAGPAVSLPNSPGPAGFAVLSSAGLPGQGAAAGSPAATQSSPTQNGPAITLDEALNRARANEPNFNAAVAASRSAQLDRSIARAALLPQVVYQNQFIYTEGARFAHHPNLPTGASQSPGSQTFIANNAVHEYISQGSVVETLGLKQITAVAQASAAASIAAAELEISRRGLTATVIQLFYATSTTAQKIAIEQRALDEASSFVTQTKARETAGEAAHADVIKAQLTQQQRERDLADAKLATERAKLDLAVLLFPDPRTPYTVTLPAPKPLDNRGAFETAANNNNPELRSALQTLRARNLDIYAAKAAYLPDLSLNFLYGIDAAQFALNGRRSIGGPYDDAVRNLGYGVIGTLNIPVFDWFATQNRIRQARVLRDAATTVLTSAQRTLIAQLEEFYNEAALAGTQVGSLEVTVDTARESLRLTRLRYTAGEATAFEVVDAQNTLAQAELAHTDGLVRYQLALANLQILTGTI